MEAKVNESSEWSFRWCPSMTGRYHTIWVKIMSLLPFSVECFLENFRLVYNNKTHKTSNPIGVDIRIPGFGETDSVEWLSHVHICYLSYYARLVENMVTWGYVRSQSVRGAPYDFRKSPNELDDYYKDLTTLIECTFADNNNTKVVVISHSLGSLVILYYLNHRSQEWKDKYIRSFITMAAPWGGSVKAMKLIASGDDVGIITVNALKARALQRSLTSTAFLMPSNQFWNKSEVLIQTAKRNYTVSDYKQFFVDLNFTDGYLIREDTDNLVNPLKPPNVEVHCLYGYGLDTTKSYVYKKGRWPDKQPKPIMGDGDRTVNIRSLKGCLPWQHLQKQPFHYKTFQRIEHVEILKRSVVIEHLREILIKS